MFSIDRRPKRKGSEIQKHRNATSSFFLPLRSIRTMARHQPSPSLLTWPPLLEGTARGTTPRRRGSCSPPTPTMKSPTRTAPRSWPARLGRGRPRSSRWAAASSRGRGGREREPGREQLSLYSGKEKRKKKRERSEFFFFFFLSTSSFRPPRHTRQKKSERLLLAPPSNCKSAFSPTSRAIARAPDPLALLRKRA